MAYPISLDSFTPKVNGTDDVMAIDVNELQSAISSLETKVGIDESEDTTSLDYKIAQLQSGKQNDLGYSPEDVSNKKRSLSSSDTEYPTSKAVKTAVDAKQDNLGFTPEDVSNKQTDLTASATKYPTVNAVNTGLSGKQDSLGFTPENVANKKTTITDSDTDFPTSKAVLTALSSKQDTTRVSRTTSTASITPDITEADIYELTAQAGDLGIELPSEDVAGQSIAIRFTMTTDKALTINNSYKIVGDTITSLVNGKSYEIIINQFNTGANVEYWLSVVEV